MSQNWLYINYSMINLFGMISLSHASSKALTLRLIKPPFSKHVPVVMHNLRRSRDSMSRGGGIGGPEPLPLFTVGGGGGGGGGGNIVPHFGRSVMKHWQCSEVLQLTRGLTVLRKWSNIPATMTASMNSRVLSTEAYHFISTHLRFLLSICECLTLPPATPSLPHPPCHTLPATPSPPHPPCHTLPATPSLPHPATPSLPHPPCHTHYGEGSHHHHLHLAGQEFLAVLSEFNGYDVLMRLPFSIH